jgi:hypothetical protein
LLSHVNAKGERGFMDEAARDAEIKQRRCRDRFRLRADGRAGAIVAGVFAGEFDKKRLPKALLSCWLLASSPPWLRLSGV